MMTTKKPRKNNPGRTPEAREKQLIQKTMNLVEQQIEDGTVSSSTINHFLRLASEREILERSILEKQERLITAKAESIESDKDTKELVQEALSVFREYQGEKD